MNDYANTSTMANTKNNNGTISKIVTKRLDTRTNSESWTFLHVTRHVTHMDEYRNRYTADNPLKYASVPSTRIKVDNRTNNVIRFRCVNTTNRSYLPQKREEFIFSLCLYLLSKSAKQSERISVSRYTTKNKKSTHLLERRIVRITLAKL